MSAEGAAKPPCKYGSKCYRKNKYHLEEFSHPGKRFIEAISYKIKVYFTCRKRMCKG